MMLGVLCSTGVGAHWVTWPVDPWVPRGATGCHLGSKVPNWDFGILYLYDGVFHGKKHESEKLKIFG